MTDINENPTLSEWLGNNTANRKKCRLRGRKLVADSTLASSLHTASGASVFSGVVNFLVLSRSCVLAMTYKKSPCVRGIVMGVCWGKNFTLKKATN